MAVQMYEVIAEKYVGKHRTYKKGQPLPESEIFGDKKVLLEGQKGKKNKRNQSLKDIKPSLKVISAAEAKKKVTK